MKILHFASSDGKFGSAQCLKELLKYEIMYEHQPIVITPKWNQINEYCNQNGIVNYVINYQQFMIPKHDSWPLFIIKYLIRKFEYHMKINKAIKKVESIVDMSSVSIIHTNVSVISIGALVAKRNNIPHVWHIREFGKEDFHFYSVFYNYINFMNEHANRFISISDVVKNTWIKKGIDANKIATYYDGVELEKERNLKEVLSSDVNIIMTGALSETKGQKLLIQAISQLDDRIKKDIKVDIYGSGMNGYEKYLQKLIDDKLLNSTVFLKGYDKRIRETMLNYDIGVICSASEGFGRVTIEYLLSKLVVVASNSGANPELLSEGKYGILFEPSNPSDLANAITKALQVYKNIARREDAYDYASKNYAINVNANKIISLFQQTINEKETEKY